MWLKEIKLSTRMDNKKKKLSGEFRLYNPHNQANGYHVIIRTMKRYLSATYWINKHIESFLTGYQPSYPWDSPAKWRSWWIRPEDIVRSETVRITQIRTINLETGKWKIIKETKIEDKYF